jgi:nucleotide-binding universal stress UspA family protein
MSFTTIGLIVLGVWGGIGVLSSLVMARRGHHPFTWFLLGAVFGPLVLVFVAEALVAEQHGRSEVVHAGSASGGPLSILVGIDGSPESVGALRTAIALLGSRIGRLTLAEVVDYETAGGGLPAERRHADNQLSVLTQEAAALAGLDPATVVLAGRPADALLEAALDARCHLLVIGGRGHGATKAVLGSVARQLTANAPLPVLVVGGDAVVATRGLTAGVAEMA